jgi:1-acyl-sn-glycerol-3-phosphate acyltransferase
MRWWWHLAKFLTRIGAAPTWQLRPVGAENVPMTGGVLLAANHQSFLDPLLVASCLDREIHFMARRSLFEIPGFGRLIIACNTFPIERDQGDVKGVKTAIERLKAGNALLVFPEGTRTRDGRIAPMKSGVRLLAERAAVPVVPVLIDGAHKVWPRSRALPGLRGRIDIVFGRPFESSRSDDLARRIRSEVLSLRQKLGRPPRPDELETVPNVESQARA